MEDKAERNVQVCVIGCGRAGMIHARNYAGRVRGAALAALCDPVAENLHAAAKETGVQVCYSDWKEAVADPAIDAVVIVTPTIVHKEIAVAAAEAGKHVFCEKPMAVTAEECDAMIRACEENRVRLQIGFMRRFDRSYRAGYERLRAGEIGEATLIRCNTYGPSKPQEWMYDVRKSYGAVGEVCSHDFDVIRWYAGCEPVSIRVLGHNFRSPEVAAQFPEWYDTFTAQIRFENGILGEICGAQYVQYGYDNRTEVLGTKGILKVGEQRTDRVEAVTADRVIRGESVDSWRTLFREAYTEEAQAFIDSIRYGTDVQVTGEDGKRALVFVDAGLRSLLEGREVEIPRD